MTTPRLVVVLAAVSPLVSPSLADTPFMSIGDWGDTEAKNVASIMGEYSPEFILALGDNMYDNGVTSVDDPLFKELFEDQFTADSLQVPWYVCAGNHDYYGGDAGIDAEMAYSDKSDRWIYPELYYNKEVTGSDGTTFNIISIDTWRLNSGDTYVLHEPKTGRSVLRNASMVHDHYARGMMNKGKFDALMKSFKEEPFETPIQERVKATGDPEQLAWINDTLASSKADWNLVIGHFPVYSATTGEHGDTAILVAYLMPILEEYGGTNTLYFSGHDHILQHNQKSSVNYFGSGAGARTHTGVDTHADYLLGYHQGSYGFMVHSASSTELATDFVIDDESVPYSYTITK
mmetsp:Transcript_72565/g.206654  ORF Transcript_72565/g.206654 Transcript_72565/m.206654 type:complete len:347 (+) Transcript_72565:211-1251(+)